MTEILTESFCERCGTRYTFESARPKLRLKGMKTVSRGLKNFVLSDGTSMDEAMAAARSETEREVTAYQLDAFHKTFNFCMQCRQYTCPNCWNEVEARCLTCAPHLGHEIMPAPFPDLPANPRFTTEGVIGGAIVVDALNGSAHEDATDVDFDIAARLDALTMAAAPAVEPAMVAEAVVEVEPVVVTAPVVAVEPEVEPVVVTEADTGDAVGLAALAAAAVIGDVTDEAPVPETERTGGKSKGRFSRFRPGQDIDAELEAYERDHAALAAAAVVAATDDTPVADVTAEPVVVAEVAGAPEVAAEVAAEPEVVAAVVPEPEVVAEPVAAVEPKLPPAPIVEDKVAQPTWRMVAPDPDADATPALPAAATADVPTEPQWPTRPSWLGSAPAVGLPFLGRAPTPQGGLEALWAESNREVVDPRRATKPASGIAPCLSCGLSLSATAKFCRRCGTPQAT